MEFRLMNKIFFGKDTSPEALKRESVDTTSFPLDQGAPIIPAENISDMEAEKAREIKESIEKEELIKTLKEEFADALPKDPLGIVDSHLLRSLTASELKQLQRESSFEAYETIVKGMVDKKYDELLQSTPRSKSLLKIWPFNKIQIGNKSGVDLRNDPGKAKLALIKSIGPEAKKSQQLDIKKIIHSITEKRLYEEKEIDFEEGHQILEYDVETLSKFFIDETFGRKNGLGETIPDSSMHSSLWNEFSSKDPFVVLEVLKNKDARIVQNISELAAQVSNIDMNAITPLTDEGLKDWIQRMFRFLKNAYAKRT